MPKLLRSDRTPNEHAIKFTFDGKVIQSGSKTLPAGADATGFPLAATLLALPGIRQVFLLNDFMTVTKLPDFTWEELQPTIEAALKD